MASFRSVILSEVEGSASVDARGSRENSVLKSSIFRELILRQAQDDIFLKAKK
jgi:hypothetical protein